MEQSQTSVSERIQGVVTVGEWMGTIFLTIIPIVNIILLFIWAFGSNTKISKANWAKASLIWAAIAIAFYLIVILLIIGTIGSIGSRY